MFRLYLTNLSHAYDLIVLNTGFHDMQVCNVDEYERSLRQYFRQISTYAKARGSKVIYASLTRIMETKVPPGEL
jgi:hypothetical protein